MLTLHHAPQSRSSVVVWLLEELGVDYKINYCTIRRQDGSGGWDASNPHPDGKVPALVHDGALVTEMAAVVLYLTDLLPGAELGPQAGEADRGAYLTWLAWYAGELQPALMARFQAAAETGEQAEAAFAAAIARVVGALDRGPYLMGERFTAADVLIGSTLGWARQFAPPSAALDAWLARIADRPAAKRAAEKDGAIEVVQGV
ncbi:glutathione S-transferase family protein [Phreatobacter stygius]|uniref:Glutathione S-transferase family protein n=1 Tax=Phreatobacter stygius TaxID=1940610 RepID=A0A4D7B0J9_9HYPH|nr:glutathione S-transferase family protein [Phreatobacter stygius]QCI62956.1 glutathione S-transferase family protein [Phreatobacter stygius]